MKNVLVLCTGNSCRSIMAEALINHLGSKHYRALSAGSFPAGYVHPKSLQILRQHNIECYHPRSKSWDEFQDHKFDLIITVCDQAANESCPVFSGKSEKLHWSIPDPAATEGTDEEINKAFEETFMLLKTRIEETLL